MWEHDYSILQHTIVWYILLQCTIVYYSRLFRDRALKAQTPGGLVTVVECGKL